jgi:predicted nucleotidyltransferase
MELDTERELENTVKIPVDVRIINHAPLSFIYHVVKSGFVIVDKNTSIRSDFEGLIFKKYFDFQYVRREYLREITNAPV